MRRAFSRLERPPGQPLVVFSALLGGWLLLRVLLWETPFSQVRPSYPLAETPPASAVVAPPPANAPASASAAPSYAVPTAPRVPAPYGASPPGPLEAAAPAPLPLLFLAAFARFDLRPQAAPARAPAMRIVGQHWLLAAAFSHLELPPEIVAYFEGANSTLAAGDRPLLGRIAPAREPANRWSGDAWLLWRGDSAGPVVSGSPSYGRSQAGAVLRYRLAPSSGHRPAAYVRAGRALSGASETEIAAGFAARPLPGLPLSVAAEMRALGGAAGREVRPAVFAVTELPTVRLPFGLRGEAYAQGGYVGGDYATAFVDGQARIDARVLRLGDGAELRAGAAAWGGAQKRAARLDLGPSAALTFRIGKTRTRLAVDYRLRVSGDAEPDSGPALTFSAGF